MKSKNIWARTRPLDKPYATIVQGTWTWKVLKAWQTRKGEKLNRYARWFCAVYSPWTQGSYDLGDTYVRDVPHTEELQNILDERERQEAL
jgi:hypothetical protein